MKSRTRKRLITLGLVVALGTGGAAALRQFRAMRRATGIAEARERGIAAYHAGDWQTTMDELGYVVGKAGRGDAEALFRMADARQRVPKSDGSHLAEALSLARDSAIADPAHVGARRLLLGLYTRLSLWPEALRAIDAELALSGADRGLMEKRIRILHGLGRLQEAELASEALALAFPRDAAAHREVLVAMLRAGRTTDEILAREERLAGWIGEGVELETIRAEYLLAADDAEGSLAACASAIRIGLTSSEQLRALLGTLDVLAGVREEATQLIEALTGSIAVRGPVDPEFGRVLVARAFRLGLPPNLELIGPAVLANPGAASDACLGWTLLVADPAATPTAAELRAELAIRASPDAAFWLAVSRTREALGSGDSTVLAMAQHAEDLAALLDHEKIEERQLAAFLRGSALRREGALPMAEERLAALSLAPGWRVARREYVWLLLDRGQHEQAIQAVAPPMDPDPQFRRTGIGAVLVCAGLVGLAERSTEPSPDASVAAEQLQSIIDAGVVGSDVLGLLARARAASGDIGGAQAAVDRMVALGSGLDVSIAARTAGALRNRLPLAAELLLAAAAERAPDNPDVLFQRALAAHDAGRSDEAREILAAGASAASGESRVRLDRMAARLLDVTGDPGALASLVRLGDAYPTSAAVQQDVLDSRAAWTDEPTVRAAISRLRGIVGEASALWRVPEARRLLSFTPSKARASEALTTVLESVLRQGGDARALELAADAWEMLDNREQAIAYLGRAADVATNRAAVLPRLIVMLAQAGRIDEARTRLSAFVALGELGSGVARRRALLLEEFAMWNEALLQREDLARLGEEEDAIALADLYMRIGQPDRAGEILDGLLRSGEPTPQLVAIAARCRARLGAVEDGLRLFDRLSGLVAESDRTLQIGDYLRSAGAPDAARRVVQAFVDDPATAPDDRHWKWLARAAFDAGDLDAGRAAVTRGLALAPESGPLLAMRRMLEHGVTDAGLLAVLTLETPEGAHGEVVREFNEAILAFSQGQVTQQQLRAQLESITAARPLFYPAWRVLTRLLLVQGERDAAARRATEAMRIIPGDPSPAREAAEVLATLGQHEQALAAARTWLERSPGDTLDAEVAIASLQLELGRPADALAVLRDRSQQIMSEQSPGPLAAATLAAVLAANSRMPQLLPLLERAEDGGVWASACVAAAPYLSDTSVRRDWLGRLAAIPSLSNTDLLDVARSWRRLASDTNQPTDLERSLGVLRSRQWPSPQAEEAALSRASALRLLGRIDEAERDYRGALGSGVGRDREARSLLIEMLLESAPDRIGIALAEARTLADSVLQDGSSSALQIASATQLLARCHFAAGQQAEALLAIDGGLALAPTNPGLLLLRAEAQLIAGDRSGAAATIDLQPTREAQANASLVLAARLAATHPAEGEWLFRRVVEGHRGHYVALNNLAYHLLMHGGDSGEAAALAAEALGTARATGAPTLVIASICETLGAARLATQDAIAAETTFREGLSLDPRSPALLLGLADALTAQGRYGEAQRWLSEIDPAGRASLTSEQQARYERLAAAPDQ